MQLARDCALRAGHGPWPWVMTHGPCAMGRAHQVSERREVRPEPTGIFNAIPNATNTLCQAARKGMGGRGRWSMVHWTMVDGGMCPEDRSDGSQ
jgi:hypothetical protein